jgi:predicted esterase
MKSNRIVRTAALLAAVMAAQAIAAAATAPAGPAAGSQPAQPPERFIPVAYCPKTTQPPKLDGVLDDPCWKDAGTIGDFVSDKKDAFPTQQTYVRIIRDDKWIYLAVRCDEQDMAHQKVFRTGRTMSWDEDSVEMFVDVKRGDSEYDQFCANVLGATNLPLPKDDDKAVVVAGKTWPDAWTLEARLLIQGATSKPPADGDVWGVNFNRNRNREGATEYSNWSRLKGSSHFSDLFGLLVFCDRLPEVRVTSVQLGERYEGGNVALVWLTAQRPAAVRVSIAHGKIKQERTVQVRPDELAQVGVPYELKAGVNSLEMVVAAQEPLLRTSFRAAAVDRPAWARYVPGVGTFAIQTPFDALVQGEPLEVSVRTAWEGAARPEPRVKWSLIAGAARMSIRPIAGVADVNADVPDGPAVLEARISDDAGKELLTLRRQVQLAGRRLAEWTKQASDCQGRAAKLLAEAKADPMLLYAQKTPAKIGQLKAALAARNLAAAGGAVEEIEYQLGCLEKGKLPVWGHHELVYTSEVDGTEQPFFVTVPKNYDPAGKDRLPVLIWLHPFWGDGPWPRQRVVEYMGNMERACLTKGFLLVHPYGRGSQGYAADGEKDVSDVWKIVNQRWRVDPDRVYLAGFSMGGGGTARWCAWYPQMFAAGAVYSGGLRPQEAPNIRYIPMRFELGGQETFAARQEKNVEQLRQRVGRTAETIFIAHPNEGHTSDYVDFEALLEWFAQYRRVADPSWVTVVSDDLGHAGGYWVSIEQFEEYGKPASVDARIKDGVVEVTTRNVAQVALTPPPSLVEASRPLRVRLNGGQATDVKAVDGRVRLACGTRPAAGAQDILKSPALAGPIRDAYRGPLLLVTAGQDEACTAGAEAIAQRWKRWHHGDLPVVAEQKAAAEDLASHNLIVVGPWDASGLLAKVRQTAPVRIDQKGITVSGKNKDGTGLGIVFVQPNPLNPKRYIVMVTGQNPKGLRAACEMMEQEQYGGDYAVTDKGPQGVFDVQWK